VFRPSVCKLSLYDYNNHVYGGMHGLVTTRTCSLHTSVCCSKLGRPTSYIVAQRNYNTLLQDNSLLYIWYLPYDHEYWMVSNKSAIEHMLLSYMN
jgi:hypothetical protein